MSLTVATVLRSGGVYDASWVRALHRGVRAHVSSPVRFVCLTDTRLSILGVDTVPLRHSWPGWWAKVELFRDGLFSGPVWYMDLDTLPIDFLDALLAYRGAMAVLSDFYQPQHAASGVMAWTPSEETGRVYRRFLKDSREIMRRHMARSDHWYRKVWPADAPRIQDLFPGQVVSLKADARRSVPRGARLVCGHGRPRLSERQAGWAHDQWRRRAA